MENLNDVEFGVDESQEEAPILIAQRQLNIFRQVHIFNKAKRDQFDDELLALPDVVINYIKKMPGGRLLIEHLEDVKTKRGISFVKSSSDDFIAPDTTPSVSAQPMEGVPTQFVGGSLTMDANFADTFAKSMAEAFKHMPTPTINASGATAPSGDFGQFFEMIAEEIRSSRSSLLDVLKETKNITDSVIASQVSISRILEGILSSQNKGDTDTATMNNRIIASQASITKLLENLYTSNTKKNDEVTAYLDVDNKLQDFRNQLEQTINNSLTSIVNHIYDTTNKQAADIAVLDIEKRLASFKSDLEADILKSLAQMQVCPPSANHTVSLPAAKSATPDFNGVVSSIEKDFASFTDDSDDYRKKKKKKKKKNLDSVAEDVLSVPAVQMSDNIYDHSSVAPSAIKTEGIIRNSDYPHEDNFDNIDLDLPPLETDEPTDNVATISEGIEVSGNKFEVKEDNAVSTNDAHEPLLNNISVTDEYDSLDDLTGDGLDFALPEQGVVDDIEESAPVEKDDVHPQRNLDSLDDLMDDGLDFSLPEQSVIDDIEEETAPVEKDDVQPQQNLGSLDNLMNNDIGLALPEQSAVDDIEDESASIEEGDVQPQQNLGSLDDLMNNGVDLALPEQSAVDDIEDESAPVEDDYVQPQQNLDSLDDLMNSEIDLAFPEQGAVEDVEEESAPIEDDYVQPQQNLDSLDDLMNNGVDLALPEQGAVEDVEEESAPVEGDYVQTQQNLDSLDDLINDNTSSVPNELQDIDSYESLPEAADASSVDNSLEDENGLGGVSTSLADEEQETSSRYSAELDKIRAALTSDNIDISSLDEPIALDDYDDDANVSEDDDSYQQIETLPETDTSDVTQSTPEAQSQETEGGTDEDWEWEYVDENGNPIPQDENGENSEDWEWEYVEDDSSENEDNNKPE